MWLVRPEPYRGSVGENGVDACLNQNLKISLAETSDSVGKHAQAMRNGCGTITHDLHVLFEAEFWIKEDTEPLDHLFRINPKIFLIQGGHEWSYWFLLSSREMDEFGLPWVNVHPRVSKEFHCPRKSLV